VDITYSMYRYNSGDDSTLGFLTLYRQLLCYTCEDEYREHKVMHETRIPAGRYEIKLRPAGGIHPRYAKKFPDIHKGMLWLQDVPNFTWVYIHVGNTDDHSSGCILLGASPVPDKKDGGGSVANSVDAYEKVYPMMADAIENGDRVYIEIVDVA